MTQVPDDQEIGVETHFVDNPQLEIQALAYLRIIGVVTISLPQTSLTQLAQVTIW